MQILLQWEQSNRFNEHPQSFWVPVFAWLANAERSQQTGNTDNILVSQVRIDWTVVKSAFTLLGWIIFNFADDTKAFSV